MAKSQLKFEAIKFRRQGKSIRDIAHKLNVSRSSVSMWCRDIYLTPQQTAMLTERQIRAGHKGRIIGAEMNRQKRIANIAREEQVAKELISQLSERDKLMLGIALYWGEGTKDQTSSSPTVTNSDPDTILFARDWFELLGVERSMFRPYIFISETHREREKIILRFWSRTLSIPASQFGKVVFLKGTRKKIYDNHNSYYGVLALRVRAAKLLKYRIMGLIKACKEKAGVAQLVRA